MLKLMKWITVGFVYLFPIPATCISFSIFIYLYLFWLCLDMFMATLACDYSTSPPSLFLFPSKSCWGENSAVTIVSIVLLCYYFLISLFGTITYYEYDSNVSRQYLLYYKIYFKFTIINIWYFKRVEECKIGLKLQCY